MTELAFDLERLAAIAAPSDAGLAEKLFKVSELVREGAIDASKLNERLEALAGSKVSYSPADFNEKFRKMYMTDPAPQDDKFAKIEYWKNVSGFQLDQHGFVWPESVPMTAEAVANVVDLSLVPTSEWQYRWQNAINRLGRNSMKQALAAHVHSLEIAKGQQNKKEQMVLPAESKYDIRPLKAEEYSSMEEFHELVFGLVQRLVRDSKFQCTVSGPFTMVVDGTQRTWMGLEEYVMLWVAMTPDKKLRFWFKAKEPGDCDLVGVTEETAERLFGGAVSDYIESCAETVAARTDIQELRADLEYRLGQERYANAEVNFGEF